MNIFVLSQDPSEIVKLQHDKHCVKMVLETAQLLCTSLREHTTSENADALGLYKATHLNHPSCVWVRQSFDNYAWTFNLFKLMLREYTYRYNKTHKCASLLRSLSVCPITQRGLTPFPLCMPDEYKDGCAVSSYRRYYVQEKILPNSRWNRQPHSELHHLFEER